MEEFDSLIGPPQKHLDNTSILVPSLAKKIAGFSLTGEGGVPKQFLQIGPFSSSLCCEASAPMQISWTIESHRKQILEISSFSTGSRQQTQVGGGMVYSFRKSFHFLLLSFVRFLAIWTRHLCYYSM